MMRSVGSDHYSDHPSLSASLEDFAHDETDLATRELDLGRTRAQSPTRPSSLHYSEYLPDDDDSDIQSDSGGPWSPPIGRTFDDPIDGPEWQAHPLYHQVPSPSADEASSSPMSSRQSSPDYESAEEGDFDFEGYSPENIRLPSTPPNRSRSSTPVPHFADGQSRKEETQELAGTADTQSKMKNFFRFAMQAEVKATEPLENVLSFVQDHYQRATRSPISFIKTVMSVLSILGLMRVLFQPTPSPAVPDLVKVAGMAKSFEPMIFYSENGARQIGDLQDTGVAVWDLSETLRTVNMTSSPIIVKELDSLSDSLKTLALELTRFFASVDGDIDGILLVMDWAKRELTTLAEKPAGSISSMYENLHHVCSHLGLFESKDGPTEMGKAISALFGQSRSQRARATLHRTFKEFLNVMEESINNELTYSIKLFGLFEAIDRQFLNIARATIRESDNQEREEDELLSSMWTRLLGPNGDKVRKYERNKQLLSKIRERTILNKHILVDHNGRLLTLKANLETLRKKLVSPLLRSNDSSTLSLSDQINGLDGTHQHLKLIRETQKERSMERLYGASTHRLSGVELDGNAIDPPIKRDR